MAELFLLIIHRTDIGSSGGSRFSVFLFVFHGSSVDRQQILSAAHLFSIIITFYLDLFVCTVMITTDVHRPIKILKMM